MKNTLLFTPLAGIFAFAGCLVAPLTAGCGSSNSTTATATPAASSTTPSLETLRAAPVTTTVGALSLKLTATIYRNFMPTIGTNPSTLTGVVTISPQAGLSIPAGFAITSAYAVQGTNTGSFTVASPVLPITDSSKVTASVSGGPTFVLGSSASVVVSFHDAAGNNYLLQTPTVEVAAVY